MSEMKTAVTHPVLRNGYTDYCLLVLLLHIQSNKHGDWHQLMNIADIKGSTCTGCTASDNRLPGCFVAQDWILHHPMHNITLSDISPLDLRILLMGQHLSFGWAKLRLYSLTLRYGTVI